MLIEHRPALDPELSALVIAQQRELREAGAGRDDVISATHDGVTCLVAVVGGRAVGCGAWRPLALPGEPGAETGVAEIKRMFVRPSFRRRGIARQLVVALEEDVLAAGHRTIRLETGVYLPSAIGLYRSVGYHPIPAYGEYAGNPVSRCFEKHLAVLV